MISFDVRVRDRGPVFDGRAETTAARFVRAAEEEIAETGADLVRSELGRVLKRPTGYYQSRITTERAASGWRVTDGGVVYGPWLEGVGSRNAPVTRFRGYSTFRRVRTRIDRRSVHIAERVLPRYLRGMQ